MNAKTENTFLPHGVYAAVLTPINADLSCNFTALVNHCNDLILRGCEGIVLFGTTGEGCSFSIEERSETLIKIIQNGIDPAKIIMTVSCSSVTDACKLASIGVQQKCKALLIMPPFFYKNVSEEGVYNFYKKIIETVAHPLLQILLYHIPQYSGVPLTLDLVQRLVADFPTTVVGIKESEGNLALTKNILNTGKNFQVFVGNELELSEAISLGASGGISGIANAFPELIKALYEFGCHPTMVNPNNTAKTIVTLLKKYPIFPAIKMVVENQKGGDWHYLRPPLSNLTKKESLSLIQSLASYIK